MKDQTDLGTVDMFGVKRRRGRPKTGGAKSGAERQAAVSRMKPSREPRFSRDES